jgi:hypothetical protein
MRILAKNSNNQVNLIAFSITVVQPCRSACQMILQSSQGIKVPAILVLDNATYHRTREILDTLTILIHKQSLQELS